MSDLSLFAWYCSNRTVIRLFSSFQAQPKHLSCIAVSAFHLACRQHQQQQVLLSPGSSSISIPEPADLVNISQSRCSPSDLLRMQGIIASKLDLNPGAGPESPVTSLTLLRIMFSVSRAAAVRLGLEGLLPEALPAHVLHQLEILACDSMTLQYRPAEVALALLATDFQKRAGSQPGHANALMGFIAELQKYCNVSLYTICLPIWVLVPIFFILDFCFGYKKCNET